MNEKSFGEALQAPVRSSWDQFIDEATPLRPDLFRFALRLTGNPFDAEDLVHDALLRAFGALAFNEFEIRKPRAYLFRILSNLWIDECRRHRPEAGDVESVADPAPGPDQAARAADAADTLFLSLSPRERVALVLREAFEMSHAEIAELSSSSEGAVKVALHRGRRRLAQGEAEVGPPSRRPRVSRALVDRFIAALRTGDPLQVKDLLLENAEAEVFPAGGGVGRDALAERGWVRGTLYHHIAEREAERQPYPLGFQVRDLDGEPVVLVFRDYRDAGPALEEVWRFEGEGEHVARIRDYCFCPELVRFVGEHFGVPVRPGEYRFRQAYFRSDPIEPRMERL